ncbi:fibronectin type III domain-containing protein [Marinicella meishanensis]|uniref:fibronectin type III domain-containing protein n=1 Tax=Marinicella meishanensis TaxID=2873263 RepID=UPI001CBF7333|nr:fibronectin type III domain-containing protein [Marinicella sp. NBU2979]
MKNQQVNNIFKRFTLGLTLFLLTALTQAQALGVIFYSLEDGSLMGRNMTVGPYTGPQLGPFAFFGTPPLSATSRNIAYDRVAGLMWYAASDNHVHSIDWASGSAGPIINDINDGFYGAIRTLAVDENNRRLYIATSQGDVKVYNLVSNSFMYTIPFTVWGTSEPNPGNRRHLAVDDYGYLWYAAADGSFRQFNPSQSNMGYTGVQIPFSVQFGGNPGQERYFDIVRWPAGQHYLYYAATDSSIRILDLDSLTSVSSYFTASGFNTTSMPGATRAFSIDETYVESGNPPATPTNVSATDGTFTDRVRVTWSAVSDASSYALYRRDPGQSSWTPWNTNIQGTTSDDTAAIPGLSYEYSVRACNQWGCGNHSALDTGFAANTALQPPSTVTATQGTFDDRIVVNWSAVAGATSYNVTIIPTTGLPYNINVTGNSYTHFAPGQIWDIWWYSVSSCSAATGCGTQSPTVYGWKGDRIFRGRFE